MQALGMRQYTGPRAQSRKRAFRSWCAFHGMALQRERICKHLKQSTAPVTLSDPESCIVGIAGFGRSTTQ